MLPADPRWMRNEMGYSGGHVHVGLKNPNMPLVFLCSFGKGQRKSATHIHAASVKQIMCVLIIDTQDVLLCAANRKEGDGVGGPQLERKKRCPKLMPSAETVWPRAGSQPLSGQMFLLQGSHGPQLVNTLATSPEVLASSHLRGLPATSEKERRHGLSPP